MTIEELADLSADRLKALSTEELTEILRPYFNVTRPELAPKRSERKETPILKVISAEKRAALALLSEEGVDLSFLRRRKK